MRRIFRYLNERRNLFLGLTRRRRDVRLVRRVEVGG